MRDFRVETIAQTEFEEAAVWYESQRSGLGLEFIAEVDRERKLNTKKCLLGANNTYEYAY